MHSKIFKNYPHALALRQCPQIPGTHSLGHSPIHDVLLKTSYHTCTAFYGQVGKSFIISLVTSLGTQPLEVKCFENPPCVHLSYSVHVELWGLVVRYMETCGVQHLTGKGGGTKVGGWMHESILWYSNLHAQVTIQSHFGSSVECGGPWTHAARCTHERIFNLQVLVTEGLKPVTNLRELMLV